MRDFQGQLLTVSSQAQSVPGDGRLVEELDIEEELQAGTEQ